MMRCKALARWQHLQLLLLLALLLRCIAARAAATAATNRPQLDQVVCPTAHQRTPLLTQAEAADC